MPTTQEEKPAKPRQRSRKTDQRKAKKEKKVDAGVQADPVGAVMAAPVEAASIEAAQVEMAPVEVAPIEVAPIEVTPVEIAPIDVTPVETAPVEIAPVEVAPAALTVEAEHDAALSGEVLPPQVHEAAPQAVGLAAIAQAHSDYVQKSWVSGRFLVERLIAVRSLDEAMVIQSEFARQACANFVAQSARMGELYGAWAQQLFAAGGKSRAQWTRIGR